MVVQQRLFPETLSLSTADAELLTELIPYLRSLGYDIEMMGGNQFAVNGSPSDIEDENMQNTIEAVLESYKSNIFLYHAEKTANLALSMAKKKASLYKPLTDDSEISAFIEQLFACPLFHLSPSGKQIIHYLSEEEIASFFK